MAVANGNLINFGSLGRFVCPLFFDLLLQAATKVLTITRKKKKEKTKEKRESELVEVMDGYRLGF